MVTMVTDMAKVEVQNLTRPKSDKSPSPVKKSNRAERSTSCKERKNKKEHVRLERHNSVGLEDQSVSRLVACLSTLDRLDAVLIAWTGALPLASFVGGISLHLCPVVLFFLQEKHEKKSNENAHWKFSKRI